MRLLRPCDLLLGLPQRGLISAAEYSTAVSTHARTQVTEHFVRSQQDETLVRGAEQVG